MPANLLLLLLGTVTAASSILFIKAASVPAAYLGALRLIFASLIFLPSAIRSLGRSQSNAEASRGAGVLEILKAGSIPGLLLGLHFISWNWGARLTVAANASLLVNMVPLVMPILVFFLYGSRLRKREIIGTLIAVLGILILGAGSVRIDPAYLRGDLICLLSMTMFAAYVALAARYKHLPLSSYLCAVYAVGGVLCLLVGLAFEGPPSLDFLSPPNLWHVMALVLGPTLIGHSLINRSMLYLPSQVVGIAQQTQFIWAGIMAFLVFGEFPAAEFYPAAILVIAGGMLIITAHRKAIRD